jgi:DNA-directed RNA polymerase specialized sigma24 family protein
VGHPPAQTTTRSARPPTRRVSSPPSRVGCRRWPGTTSTADPTAADAEPDPHDLDEIAIERAVAGDRIRLTELTPAEQAEVVRRLTERGKSIRDIADQLATTERTISRLRRSAASAV